MTDEATPDIPSAAPVPYREIITSIVKRFVRLMGATAALNLARRIPQLSVDAEGNVLSFDEADPLGTINQLIDQYGSVFGDAAITLSQQAVKPLARSLDSAVLRTTGLGPLAQPIRLLLVDDHVLFRDGLIGLLNAQADMTVVGGASTIREGIALARDLKPEVVLMDMSLPDGSGVEATQAILAEHPEAKVIFLTVHEEDEALFAAIRAGALGYLFKNVRTAELLKSLRGVVRGEAGISRAIARRILAEFSRTPPPPAETAEAAELTARELEIIRELAQGATNHDIAAKLVISENTVKNHVHNVLAKLHLRSRREIASYARDHKLIPPSGTLPK